DPCGERGIRTPGPVTVNGFQDRRIRPLCHFSFAICFSELASANIGGFFISANTFRYKNDFFFRIFFFQHNNFFKYLMLRMILFFKQKYFYLFFFNHIPDYLFFLIFNHTKYETMTEITRLFDIPYYQQRNYELNKCFTTKYGNEWESISTSEYLEQANTVSRALLAMGVKPGDK